jgi:hypothetical protein
MTALLTGRLTDEQKADLLTVLLPARLYLKGLNHRGSFERYFNDLVREWTASGKISVAKPGYGFATSGVVPLRALLEADLEDPTTYIAAAFTTYTDPVFGDVPERYMWNAVRKIYELLRLLKAGHTVTSTLEAVQEHPKILRPAVPSENPDGTVPWGPFPFGGAVIRVRGGLAVVCAFSIWTQEQDDAVAGEAADWILNVGGHVGANEVAEFPTGLALQFLPKGDSGFVTITNEFLPERSIMAPADDVRLLLEDIKRGEETPRSAFNIRYDPPAHAYVITHSSLPGSVLVTSLQYQEIRAALNAGAPVS